MAEEAEASKVQAEKEAEEKRVAEEAEAAKVKGEQEAEAARIAEADRIQAEKEAE